MMQDLINLIRLHSSATLLGSEAWRWTLLFLSLLLGLIVSKIAGWILKKYIRALTLKTRTDLDTKIVDLLSLA